MTAADQVIQNVAGKFDTPALAIIARCAQSGVHLRLDGESLKAKGDHNIIAAWQPIIGRHKPEIIAALSGQSFSPAYDAAELAVLAADYQELTACITELCQLAKYSDDARERMLTARQNLYPSLYAIELAYFRLQVIRAKTGTYWEAVEHPHNTGNTIPSPKGNEARTAHPAGRGRA